MININDVNFCIHQKTHDYGYATRGYCPEPCTAFTYYLLVQIIVKTIASTGRVGSSVVHLRSVADEDKALALGTLTVFISLFGFIPAPIIMGAIIDSACLVWDETCGVTGNCWLYDSDKFRVIVHLVPGILILVSVIGDIVMFKYSRRLDLYGEKEDDIELNKTDVKEKKDNSTKQTSQLQCEEIKPLKSGQS
ncbi:hypothetical protein SK128_027748 [Halocaridina rubra]|uniref:Solute carrier organic anion transporter family member 5A1 n=1 Tax=Halocaridina rubra TaxID=373956 RepID=A0AAN9AGQ7_HALRR